MHKVFGNVWIESNNKLFITKNQSLLLQQIRKTGSITKAAKAMRISYRHAWELIDSMNRISKSPVVEATSGGFGGGGTKLTRIGENSVKAFNKLCRGFERFARAESKKIKL